MLTRGKRAGGEMAIARGSGRLPQSLSAGLQNLLASAPKKAAESEHRQPDHLRIGPEGHWQKILNAPDH